MLKKLRGDFPSSDPKAATNVDGIATSQQYDDAPNYNSIRPILKKNPEPEIKPRIRIAGKPTEHLFSLDVWLKRKQMFGWYSCDSNPGLNLRPRIRFFLIWVLLYQVLITYATSGNRSAHGNSFSTTFLRSDKMTPLKYVGCWAGWGEV